MVSPLQMLVVPAATWGTLAGNTRWWFALGVQWFLVLLGLLVGKSKATEIAASIGLFSDFNLAPWLDTLVCAIATVLVVVAGNWLLALFSKTAVYAIGRKLPLNHCLTWVSHSLIPLSMGFLLSQALLVLANPQPISLEHALALILHPDSISLAAYLPDVFPPLSLSWFVVSYLDAFTIWSLWLLLLGAKYYLRISMQQGIWFAVMLMLSLLVILTGMWQTSEWLVVSIATS